MMRQTRLRQLTEQEKRSLREQQMITNWIKSSSKGVLSIFSDPSDLWKLITEYLPSNKEAIMARGEYKVIIPNLSLRKDEVLIPYIESDGKIYYKTTTIGNDDNTKNNYHICQEEIDWQIKQGFIRNTPGKLVIKTNGGDPVDIICGKIHINYFADSENGIIKISENEGKGVIELLWDIFGGIVNEQGYKVLDSHIGAIYSDSITPEHQVKIYERLAAKGFAATNIVLGIDSYSMEYTTKNLSSIFAKSTWFEIKNLVEEATDNDLFDEATDQYERKSYNIYKDPVIDDKNKNSLAGLLQVYYSASFMEPIGCLKVKTDCTFEEENKGFLQVIYENGVFKNQTSLQTIRKKLLKN